MAFLERVEFDKVRARGTIIRTDGCGPELTLTLGPGEPITVVIVDSKLLNRPNDPDWARQKVRGRRVIVECALSISSRGVSVSDLQGLSHVRVIDELPEVSEVRK